MPSPLSAEANKQLELSRARRSYPRPDVATVSLTSDRGGVSWRFSVQARIAEDQGGSQAARSARAHGGSASKRGQAGMQPGKVGSPGTAMADALRRPASARAMERAERLPAAAAEPGRQARHRSSGLRLPAVPSFLRKERGGRKPLPKASTNLDAPCPGGGSPIASGQEVTSRSHARP